MAFIRPSAPSFWRKNTVPNFPVEVDWQNGFAGNLVGYWLLDGLPIADLSAQNGVAALTGSPVSALAGGGPALAFNNGPYATISYTSAFNTSNFTFSILATATAGQGANRSAFDCRTTSPYSGFVFYATSGNVWQCWNGNGNNFTFTTTFPVVLGETVALTVVGTTGAHAYFYVNGELSGTLSSGSSITPTVNLIIGARSGPNLGQLPFQGILSNAFWLNRALDAADVQMLAAEPFAMLRPKREVWYYSAPSGGTPVSMSAIFATEWLASSSASAIVPAEWLASEQVAGALPMEFLASQANAIIVPTEYLASTDGAAPIPTEYLGTDATSAIVPTEYLASSAADAIISIEYQATTAQDASMPVEYLATINANAVVPVEWSGATLVTSAAQIAIEWSATITPTVIAPVEFLASAGSAAIISAEWNGTTLSNMSVALEYGATLSVNEIIAAEFSASLAAAGLIPAEWNAGQTVSMTVPVEWGGAAGIGVQSNAVMPVEWIVASLIVPDFRFAVTFYPPVDQVRFATPHDVVDPPVDQVTFAKPVDVVE